MRGGCFCVGMCGMCGDVFVWGGVGLQGTGYGACVRRGRGGGSAVPGVLQEKRSSDWSRACFPYSSVPASC